MTRRPSDPPGELLSGPEWDVQERVSIAASTEQAWQLISQPGHLEQCHPFCRRHTVYRWPDFGARDEIEYYSGLVLERDFTAWLDGQGYDLLIGPPERITNQVSWRLHPVAPSSCELSIRLRPLLPPDRSRAAFLRLHTSATAPSLHDYLRSVVEGVRHRVETGRSVTRNQFGSHPTFSPDEADGYST
jgi:hypothetical protein